MVLLMAEKLNSFLLSHQKPPMTDLILKMKRTKPSYSLGNIPYQNPHSGQEAQLEAIMLEKITFPISSKGHFKEKECEIWGSHIKDSKSHNRSFDIQRRRFLTLKATLFQLTSAHRASYAALELFKVFKDSPQKIGLLSSPRVDHYVVCIGNNNNWKIYDPLLNPELLFNLNEYRTEILPQFPNYPGNKPNFKVKIAEKVHAYVQKRSLKIQNFVKDSLIGIASSDYLKDLGFQFSCMRSMKNLPKETTIEGVRQSLLSQLNETSQEFYQEKEIAFPEKLKNKNKA